MSLCRRMPSRCFQVILLFTGHGNSPPMYGMRDCRDPDKMLCNNHSKQIRKNKGAMSSLKLVRVKCMCLGIIIT